MADVYDRATREWFNKHPREETTVMTCEGCGLSYKPCLGHRCEIKAQLRAEANNG